MAGELNSLWLLSMDQRLAAKEVALRMALQKGEGREMGVVLSTLKEMQELAELLHDAEQTIRHMQDRTVRLVVAARESGQKARERGRRIHHLQRKLRKMNRRSARQHRALKERNPRNKARVVRTHREILQALLGVTE